MNPSNRKVDQSLSEFQTGIDAAAHATLDTEQLISHTRVKFIDTISFLKDSEGGVISVSEVHQLLTRINDILDNVMSKWVGNTTHILAHVFNSATRQHHEVWTSQLPFLYSLKDMVPPHEVCFFGCINWSVAKAQQVFHGLVSIFSFMSGAKPD